MRKIVASRQWSTGTLAEGLQCVEANPPKRLLALSSMPAESEDAQKLQASNLEAIVWSPLMRRNVNRLCRRWRLDWQKFER